MSGVRQESLRVTQERDEARREVAALQYRHSQFQHELRRREGEMERLQDRMRQLLTDRKRERQQAELALSAGTAPAPAAGPRAPPAASKAQQEERYRQVIGGYESRVQELLLEQRDTRAALEALQQEHKDLVNKHRALQQQQQAAAAGGPAASPLRQGAPPPTSPACLALAGSFSLVCCHPTGPRSAARQPMLYRRTSSTRSSGWKRRSSTCGRSSSRRSRASRRRPRSGARRLSRQRKSGGRSSSSCGR